ncbi:MAG: hypothetical protein ACUZ8H_15655, partial [Candidatus Anammoxibacter sp.]
NKYYLNRETNSDNRARISLPDVLFGELAQYLLFLTYIFVFLSRPPRLPDGQGRFLSPPNKPAGRRGAFFA